MLIVDSAVLKATRIWFPFRNSPLFLSALHLGPRLTLREIIVKLHRRNEIRMALVGLR
ncbi:hypothetical protein Hanom_Chr03g00216791 [Helianthus anomalus]